MTGKCFLAACAATAVAMLAAGCSSAGSGATGPTTAMSGMSFGAPEKTTLNVGVVPAMDSAGFFVALNQGLFAKEGLTIKYSPEPSSENAIALQEKGTLDISGGNYVSYITAEMENPTDNLEVVSEGSIMEPGSQVILTMPNSPIKSLSQVKGRVFGINAPYNINYLLAASVLEENGINPSGVDFPGKVNASNSIPFPSMPAALAKGTVAVAAMPEPFASIAEQSYGAVVLADQNQGATQNFPIQGYVVTKQWAQQNPHTLDRFLAALSEGQEIADTNRAAVETAFEKLSGPADGQVSAKIADVMALNSYPIGIDASRLQRVSDVMYQFGLEPGRKTPYNVNSMLMPSGAFDFTPFESGTTSS